MSANKPTATPAKPSTAAATPSPVLNSAALNLSKIELLHQHFPQVLEVDAKGNYVVNAAKLQLALDPAGLKVEEDGYELRWAGKREAYHTAFTPAQTVLNPLPAESKDWDSTGNVLLRGDNLDALRLLRHSYFGKVKLIYIDPPYNTQSDAFIYRDDFSVNQSQVLEALGYDKDTIEYIKNIYGAKTHSGWLSFMYPRLLLAKDLLRDDGVIFISIDDNEQAQLKLLCDEVFGEHGFVAAFPWRKRTAKSDVPFGVSQDFEWVMCYAKDAFLAGNSHERDYYSTPDYPNDRWRLSDLTKQTTAEERENSAFDMVNPKNGAIYPFNPKRVWSVTSDTFNNYYEKGKIVFPEDYEFLKIKTPAYRVFESEDKAKALKKYGSVEAIKTVSTLFPKEVGMSESGNKDFLALFNAAHFSFPKPVALLQYLFGASTENNDLILDFFAGSGTTGEAVMQLNAEDGGTRQFILVQIPQPIDAKKQKEAHQFVTQALGKPATIFEITAERLRRAGAAIAAKQAAEKTAASAKAGGLLAADNNAPTAAVDTGFRVFDIVPDIDALILQKPLATATQDDLSFYTDGSPTQAPATETAPVGWASAHHAAPQNAASTAMHDKTQHVLHNLLLSEGLPLTTRLKEIMPSAVYLAHDVALIVAPVELDALSDALTALRSAGTPAQHLTIYAPWMRSDNFMQGIKTLVESLGYSAEKLRLRG